MAPLSFSPRFVKAKVTFKHIGMTHQVGEVLVNREGLPSIPWKTFDPKANLGKRVAASVQVLSATPWEFNCDALITAERTSGQTASALGLVFLMKPADAEHLDADVAAEGVLPEYVRKMPRIHFMESVPIFPSRAIIRFFYNQEDISVACDVENLSPSGFNVFTDDPRSAALMPDETVRVHLQPRGNWLRAIQVNAQVKRVTDMVDAGNGNLRRHFGLGISTISAEAKNNFTELLRQIVLQSKR